MRIQRPLIVCTCKRWSFCSFVISNKFCFTTTVQCNYTGWAKSQYPYVRFYSSVTECLNEIILSGMTYYHHWFKEFVKSKHICVHFFEMKVHFRIYLIVWIVGSSQILSNCVWPFKLRLSWKNESSSFSDDRDIKLNEVSHYVWSGDWVEARSALWESCKKPNYGVVIG